MLRSPNQKWVVVSIAWVVMLAGGCSRTPEEKYARFLAAGKKKLEARDYSHAALEFQCHPKYGRKMPKQLGLAPVTEAAYSPKQRCTCGMSSVARLRASSRAPG